MPLTNTQTLILTAAAQHPEGVAMPPASLPPAPHAAVAKALLRAGLLAPAEGEHADPGAAWKLDGAMVVLRITETGLRAIGVELQGMPAQLGDAVLEVLAAASATTAAATMPADRDSESLTASGAECVSSRPAD